MVDARSEPLAKLAEYRRKRHFDRTPEPAGRVATTSKKSLRAEKAKRPQGAYVIQKHAARRLHYDFRLELDGVLLSWAVPKGPSLDPTERRLAVHVEDHPVEYGEFEGTIPQGEYGGGTVMLWDRGTWTPLEDPKAGHKKGHLKFVLNGERLKGAFSLVRIRGGDDKEDADNWLLIKSKDEYATTKDPLKADTSVASGRKMEEIASGEDSKVWKSNRQPRTRVKSKRPTFPSLEMRKRTEKASAAQSNGKAARPPKSAPRPSVIHPAACTNARAARQPTKFLPQLATLVSKVPAGDKWVHELKLDGYRLLCFLEDGKVRLVSRNGNDWTRDFPTIVWAAQRLPVKNAILDGEAVVVRPDGTTDFQALQNSIKDNKIKSVPIRYYLFDLPFCEGFDLTRSPLIERKTVLKDILSLAKEAGETLVYSDHIEGEGEKVFEAACSHAMEGVVSKLADSPYMQRRTHTWVKTKCLYEQEFVIGGFTDPSNSRKGFGALLLGYYEGDDFIFAGRVGTGFTDASLQSLHKQLSPLEMDKPAFANPPKGADAKGVHWVRPKLIAEVEFNEWTNEGILRHPSFKGLRSDKDPREVVREQAERPLKPEERTPKSSKRRAGGAKPAAAKSNAASPAAPSAAKPARSSVKAKAQLQVAGVTISNPDRVLYPEQGITKGELARFYEAIAEWALPHMEKRPLSLVRCPTGAQAGCFYQKHLTEYMPAGIGGVPIKEKSETREYVYIRNLKGLIGLVQMGVLEIHPWGCRVDEIEKPDRLIFDLDPGPGVEWAAVVAGTKRLREFLQAVGLESFLKTSGGKGMHVVAPIARTVSWDQLKEFAHAIVRVMAREEPHRYLTVMTKAKRQGKIFLDYLRNGRGATCVAAYSTRARAGAPVSTPVFWEELTTRLRPDRYNVRNLLDRLRSEQDPWSAFFTTRQTLTSSALRAVAKLST